jgi:hypothetical protein
LAKPNYQFEKRQRDLAKKKKKEEKRLRKLAGKDQPEDGAPEGGAPEDGAAAIEPQSGDPTGTP